MGKTQDLRAKILRIKFNQQPHYALGAVPVPVCPVTIEKEFKRVITGYPGITQINKITLQLISTQ